MPRIHQHIGAYRDLYENEWSEQAGKREMSKYMQRVNKTIDFELLFDVQGGGVKMAFETERRRSAKRFKYTAVP